MFKKNKNRLRKKIFTDRKVQGGLVLHLTMHWLSFVATIGVVLFILEMMLGAPGRSFGEQVQSVWENNSVFMLVLAVLFPAFIFDSVKLSHRFAGPVFRLRREMQAMAEGKDIGKVTFRDGDYWCELAEYLNVIARRVNTAEAAAAANSESQRGGSSETPVPSDPIDFQA